MDLKSRIKKYLKYKKVSQAYFGEKLNKSAGWVNNVGNSLKDEQLRLLKVHFPELSTEWLLTGKGEMIINILENQPPEYKADGKIINPKDYPEKKVYIIPVKGRGGLENAFYDKLILNELDIEKLSIKKTSSKGSQWFKIEVEGVSMDDSTPEFEGSKYSLCEGDWAYCRSIPKIHWKNKLHFDKVKIFCFFHNIRGIIFKKVIEHNTDTGELTLHSLNQDKERFPDFKINIAECSYICNVLKVITEFN